MRFKDVEKPMEVDRAYGSVTVKHSVEDTSV